MNSRTTWAILVILIVVASVAAWATPAPNGSSYWQLFWSSANLIMERWQHWITSVGLVLTLVALLLSFIKMKGAIDRFKQQATAHTLVANLATIRAMVEGLLTNAALANNKPLLQQRIMNLTDSLTALRTQIASKNRESLDDLQKSTTTIRGFQKQLTRDLHSGSSAFKKERFLSFLADLKGHLNRLEAETNILSGDTDHVT